MKPVKANHYDEIHLKLNVDPDGKVAGMTTDERDAKDIGRRNKLRLVTSQEDLSHK